MDAIGTDTVEVDVTFLEESGAVDGEARDEEAMACGCRE